MLKSPLFAYLNRRNDSAVRLLGRMSDRAVKPPALRAPSGETPAYTSHLKVYGWIAVAVVAAAIAFVIGASLAT